MLMPDPLINFRATESDQAVISELREKLGLNVTSLIRLALRKLLTSERRTKDTAAVSSDRQGKHNQPGGKPMETKP